MCLFNSIPCFLLSILNAKPSIFQPIARKKGGPPNGIRDLPHLRRRVTYADRPRLLEKEKLLPCLVFSALVLVSVPLFSTFCSLGANYAASPAHPFFPFMNVAVLPFQPWSGSGCLGYIPAGRRACGTQLHRFFCRRCRDCLISPHACFNWSRICFAEHTHHSTHTHTLLYPFCRI